MRKCTLARTASCSRSGTSQPGMSTRFCAGNGGLFGCERCDVKCLGAGASHRHKLRGNHETDATICVYLS